MTKILYQYSPTQLAEVVYLMGRIEGNEQLALSRSGSFFEHRDHKFAVNQISYADARLLETGFTYTPHALGGSDLLEHCETGEKFTLESVLLDLDFCEFTECAKEKALAERRRIIEEARQEMDKISQGQVTASWQHENQRLVPANRACSCSGGQSAGTSEGYSSSRPEPHGTCCFR